MSRRLALVTTSLVAVVAFLVGVLAAGPLGHTQNAGMSTAAAAVLDAAALPPAPIASPSSAPAMRGTSLVDFAGIAARLNNAVVSIDTTSRPEDGSPLLPKPVRPGSPTLDGQRDSGPDGGHQEDEPQEGAGSGFIISPDGVILTNNHVIDKADRITVVLYDGRRVHARVLGADADTDIAIIKVDPSGPLPYAQLGDSSRLRVGDWVCAIGNPLNYSHSLTVGVVSYLGRKLFDSSLDDYIQTDAAINLGSSGGPLIDTDGKVVGINAAISWRARGIGFAVPINIARAILPQLESRGRVSRGYIGITLKSIDPDLQRSLKLAVAHGAMVQDITPDSPGAQAGLRPYDVIVAVDGRAVADNDALVREIAGHRPGTTARIQFYRDGGLKTLSVRLGERPERARVPRGRDGDGPIPAPRTASLGITVRARNHQGDHGLPGGVVVSEVDPIGPSYESGIEAGNIILEINRHHITSMDDYRRILQAARPGDVLTFYLYNPELNQRVLRTVRIDEP